MTTTTIRAAAAAANTVVTTVVTTTNADPTSSQQRLGLAIILFFPLLAVLVVCLRVYSRVRTKQFGLDDHVVLLATTLSIGETVACYRYIKTNFVGIHYDQVPAVHDEHAALVWSFVVQVLYNPILALVKTSVLLFLLKLGSQKRAVRRSIYALNAFNLALMVAIFLVVIFQCNPIAYNWDLSIKNGHCIHRGTFYMATAALTIFTDILSLALPFWVFLDLKLPRRVKVALLFVFLLGGLYVLCSLFFLFFLFFPFSLSSSRMLTSPSVTAISIVRLVFFYKAFFLPANSDPTYSLAFCLSAIEVNLAIVCASAPSLRGLVRYWFPHFFSSNRANYNYDYRYRYGYPDGSGRGQHGGHGQPGGRACHIYGTGSVSTKITSRWKDGGRGRGSGKGGGSSDERWPKHRSDVDGGDSFALNVLPGSEVRTHTDVQSHSLSASEEEIMTYNGIVRTMNVSVQYDTEEQDHSHDRSQESRPGSSLGERRSLGGEL